jgi:hypothetical protein
MTDRKLTLAEATAPEVAAEPTLTLSEALAPYLPGARRRDAAAPAAAWADSLDGPALADRLTRLAGDVRWCSPAERAAVLREAAGRVTTGDSTSPGLTRLAREIRNTAAEIGNGLTMRRDHPSYGYTKAALRERLAQLQGMITGHLIAAGDWDQPGAPLQATLEHADAYFGLDLHDLARAIKESR